ncbi:hypothetical protein JIG36_48540 [Actinoplanes sp. LDG1-06]|uniref:Uncharacterized protein n=1 Tax=Paractinoplanes ovalisporus TaxID=2810368 RepID=A0ABS2AU75_9ACTN|nr:hypothetical protein [Actinoplanes ovalisporus]MBM2623371.1 hypothetical protein [Actinoplanes ovalisporus]
MQIGANINSSGFSQADTNGLTMASVEASQKAGRHGIDPGELNDDLMLTILEICEKFLASTTPTVRQELDMILHLTEITGGSGWLIRMLVLTRMRLPDAASQPRQRAEVRSKLAEIDGRATGQWG